MKGTADTIEPIGNGLINDSYKVATKEKDSPDYVLQRINHAIFQNVDLLQNNMEFRLKQLRETVRDYFMFINVIRF